MKPQESDSGFTLVELLVVVGLVVVWICILAPALARTSPDAKPYQCQNNLRQLTQGWMMYSSDYNGTLPLNNFSTATYGGQDKTGWITGWMDWTPSNGDNTNTLFIADERYAKLAAYFGRSARLFKCPADIYRVNSLAGLVPRVRSISMNAALGASSDGAKESYFSGTFFVAKSVNDLVRPAPASVWVLADEQADSINDGCLINNPLLSPSQYYWLDLPAAYHNGAGSFSFADGHTELRRWAEASTLVPVNGGGYVVPGTPGSRDFAWVASHTPVRP